MHELDLDRLRPVVARHPYPLLFATVSGAHLYGFPSTDSDVDWTICSASMRLRRRSSGR